MACAVGFGGINVTSSLGRPLVAEIELVAVDKADKSSLNAHLASPEAFKGAGIDYPYALPKLKFQVETRANGESYIKVSSDQAVNDPFVSLLLELTWSSGRLLREYTFLLDPPGFVAEQPPAAAVSPIEPVVAPAVAAAEPVAASAVPVAEPVVAPMAASAPQAEALAETAPHATAAEQAPAPVANEAASAVVAEVTKPAEAKVETPAATPKEESHPAEVPVKKQAAAAPITVKQGDTLAKIANKAKAPDVTLERMLVALYHANEQEFDGHNMNRIRTGKILRLPEADELAKVQQPEAVEEVHAQVADWNAYRQKLAAANTPATERHAKQEVAGKISTSISDKAPVAKESAKEVLKLSKGDAEGDQASAGGKAKSAQEKAIAKEDEAIAKAKAMKETEQRAALLEKNIKEMQRLVELKNQAASANASAVPLIASSVIPASAAVPAAAPASAVAPAKPKVVEPKVVAEPPTLLDELLDDPVKLGAAAAAIVGLGLLGVVRSRRSKKGDKPSTNKVAEPIISSADELASFIQPEEPAAAPVDSDEVDPIKEADLFLNFGRDVQAEEVLKEALLKDPTNNQIKLKLLSIYATRNDTKSFQNYALEIKKSRDESSWEQAAAMGRDIDPDNALYDGGIDSVVVASVKVPVEETKSALDFDADIPPALDFDLGDDEVEKVAVSSAVEMPAVKEMDIDFDLSEVKPEEPKLEFPALDIDVDDAKSIAPATPVDQAPSLNLDDLVFESTPTAAPVVEPEKALEFTMDFPSEAKPAAASAVQAKDIGLSEISLNLDEPATPSTPQTSGNKDEHWQEVATKLDLAKAYQEMGDQAGAREILEEVVRDGDASQREIAESLLQQLS
jgi:pilus assembly protein FimV